MAFPEREGRNQILTPHTETDITRVENREKRAHSHENGKVKVLVTQLNIIVNELPKNEEIGYAYDWLRRQQRKKEEEEKKRRKIEKRMRKLTRNRKK